MISGATRLVLVDDHCLVRESISRLLMVRGKFDVVALAGNADAGLQAVREHKPDLVLMDIDMPGSCCFDAAQEMVNELPTCKVVFFSGFWHDRYIERALAAHAWGYLVKSITPRDLIESLNRVASGAFVVSPQVRSRIMNYGGGESRPDHSSTRLSTLTERELEVLRDLGLGYTRSKIAERLALSEHTVAVHVSAVMRKLDFHDRVSLAKFAIREGLSRLDEDLSAVDIGTDSPKD